MRWGVLGVELAAMTLDDGEVNDMTFFGKDLSSPLGDLQAGINRLFDQVWHSGIQAGPFDGQDCAPPTDVIEKDDRYVVEVELPGISREDVDVSCTSSRLTITGQKVHCTSREEGDRVLSSERRFGGFSRVVEFADEVKSEELSAKLEEGLLRVIAPKKTVVTTHGVSIPIDG